MAYRQSWRFYPLAILAHFAVDFSTFGAQALTNSLGWTMLVFAGWVALALARLLAVRRGALNRPAEQFQSVAPATLAALATPDAPPALRGVWTGVEASGAFSRSGAIH